MDDPTAPRVGELLQQHLQDGTLTIPGLPPVGQTTSVRLLGAGESYAAWLVRDGAGRQVLWRIPRREPQDMPRPMAQEFAALREVPAGLATRGLAMDDTTDNPLGMRYLITTYVPGAVLPVNAWNSELLLAHARQLALLHQPLHAEVGAVGGPGEGRLDLLADFDDGWAWWSTEHPEVTDVPHVEAMADQVRRFLARRATVFKVVERYSLIHGDLVATNVVVDEHQTPRLIDWEWAQIGDIAQDLAYIGGLVHGGPWYVPMTNQQVEDFLRTYATAGAMPLDVTALRERRDAWEVYERFLSSLHFMKQARIHRPDSLYPAAVESLHQTLRQRLEYDER